LATHVRVCQQKSAKLHAQSIIAKAIADLMNLVTWIPEPLAHTALQARPEANALRTPTAWLDSTMCLMATEATEASATPMLQAQKVVI
jgi:hypothetical protein